MKKRKISLILVLFFICGATPVFQLNATAANAGDALADYAVTQVAKTSSSYSNDSNWIANDWCAWFVTYCASKVGLASSASNTTDNIFPPIEKSTWTKTSPNWAATNEVYEANWFTTNNKGTLYYFDLGNVSNNSNCVQSDRGSFEPKRGDLLYCNGWGHVGIVTNYNSSTGYVTMVAGNESGQDGNWWQTSRVNQDTYYKTSTYINAYLRPTYDNSSTYKSYPCDLTAIPNGVVKVWSKPGNTQTYSDSSVIYNIGGSFKVTNIIENAASHYWYQMKTPDGTTGYVWAENVSRTSQRWSVSASGVNKPENLSMTNGHSQIWPCTGTVSTGGGVITDVQGFIYSGNTVVGSAVTSSEIKHPNATSANLSIIDDSMLFNAVTQSGYYTYVVKAKIKSAELVNGTLSEKTSDWLIIEETRSYYYVGNSTPSTYSINVFCTVDGESRDNLTGIGVFDVYINSSLDASNVSVYPSSWPSGTEYEITNIRGFGYQYVPAPASGVKGKIGNSDAYASVIFIKIPQSLSPANSITYNNHRYERYDYHLSWTEAKAFCENKGGHLVSITNAQEQAAVVNLLSGCPFGVYYIGGYDLEESGNWSWVSGEPFTYENWDRDYQEGVHQDPDNFYSAILGHDNPVSKQTGEWIDNPNEVTGGFYGKQNSGFICEYEKTYTVSYDANGGTSAPESQKKAEGVALRLSTDFPQNTIRYNFIGWSTNPNATTPEYYGGDLFEIDADTMLYAVWEENLQLSYDANGGTGGPASGMVRAGTQVYIDQNTPIYEGHEFLGWATEQTADVAEYQPGDHISVTQDTTLYAVWKAVFVSDWTETRPAGIKDELIETKIQYRYSTKETTTDTVSSKPGWTLTESQQVWGNYGDWSSWSLDAVSKSDSCDVDTGPLYRYYYFYCAANCGRHEPYSGYCDCGAQIIGYSVKWSHIPYNQSNPVSYDNRKMHTMSLGDGQRWNFSSGNLNSSAIGTKDVESDATVIDTGYRYRTRSQSTVYNFERWTDWSEWSDTPIEASDTKRMETRTLYRCKIDEDRVLTLPGALTKIESEAFQNIAADAVVIPESVRSIADDAFDAGIVIIGKTNSYAQLYAGWNNLLFIPSDDLNG